MNRFLTLKSRPLQAYYENTLQSENRFSTGISREAAGDLFVNHLSLRENPLLIQFVK